VSQHDPGSSTLPSAGTSFVTPNWNDHIVRCALHKYVSDERDEVLT
jgi:hypothetical protein